MDFAKFFQPCQISKYLCFLFFIPAPISSLPFQYVFSINFIPSIHRFPHSLSLKSSLRLQLPTATMCAIFSQPDPTNSEVRAKRAEGKKSLFRRFHLSLTSLGMVIIIDVELVCSTFWLRCNDERAFKLLFRISSS